MERKSAAGVVLGIMTAGLALCAPSGAQAKPYKGGEIYSSQAYLYGRMEVRMRMARGSGLLSTFFTYKGGSEIEGTFWEEIDIEVLGKDDAVAWQSNIITGLGTRTTSEQIHTNAFSLADDYHTYALEWTPDHVAWELDGVVVRETTGGQVTDLSNPQTLRFNIWAANIESWVGGFDEGALPQYQYVSWIRYYRYEGGQLILDWTDDFDSFDAGRWGRADWTFAENLADFDPNNVVVRDGTLVLALTREGQTGFSGTVPFDSGENTGGTGGTTAGGGGSSVGGTAGSEAGGGTSGSGGASDGGASDGGTSDSGGVSATGGYSDGGDVSGTTGGGGDGGVAGSTAGTGGVSLGGAGSGGSDLGGTSGSGGTSLGDSDVGGGSGSGVGGLGGGAVGGMTGTGGASGVTSALGGSPGSGGSGVGASGSGGTGPSGGVESGGTGVGGGAGDLDGSAVGVGDVLGVGGASTAGGSTSPAEPAGVGGPVASAAPNEGETGCSCRLGPGRVRGRGGSWLLWIGLGWVALKHRAYVGRAPLGVDMRAGPQPESVGRVLCTVSLPESVFPVS